MTKRYFFLVLVSAFMTAAQAQEARLSLHQCFALAAENNLAVKSAEKSVDVARSLQGTAWDIGRTELSLSQDPTSGGSPDNALTLSQQIDFPTVYMARHAQLKAETQAARSRAGMVSATLKGDIASLYHQLAYEQECVRLLRRQDSVLTRYRQLAEQRLAVGETRRLEVITAERLQRENQMTAASMQTQLEATQQQLASLLGTDLRVLPADTFGAVSYASSGYDYAFTPEGRYASDLLAVADREVSVARSGYAPTLSVALRNQLVISSWDPYNQQRSRFDGGNFMGFEVGVGIPLFFGATKARVRAARESRERTQLELQQQQQTLQRDYATALSRQRAAQVRLDYYEGEGLQKADELARLASLEYEAGEIGYVEYTAALQESIGLSLKRAEAVNDYNQSVVTLQRLCNGFGE